MGTSVTQALFGQTKQAVLAVFFRHPERRFYLRQAIQLVGRGFGTVQREIRVLTDSGVLVETVEGRQKYYQANTTCRVYPELKSLITKTAGIADALTTALDPLRHRVALAFIYGS